ncbi:hypothetical protein [Parabacteroides sp.]
MKSTINERIANIIAGLGYKSIRQFAMKIDVAPTSLNDIVKNNAEPKFSTLDKIITAEPSISPDWLLTGQGSMERVSQRIGDISNSSAIGNNVNGSGNSISHNDLSDIKEIQNKYLGLLQKKDEQIDRLLSIIEKLSNDK